VDEEHVSATPREPESGAPPLFGRWRSELAEEGYSLLRDRIPFLGRLSAQSGEIDGEGLM